MLRAQTALAKRQRREAAGKVTADAHWKRLLQQRAKHWQATEEDEKEYQRQRAEQHRGLKRKFPTIYTPGEDGKDLSPKEWRRPLAHAFRKWARFGSWTMCSECHRMQPHKFQPTHARQPGKTGLQAQTPCSFCKHGVGYWAPKPEDVPEPLRNLTTSVVEALTVFDINTGVSRKVPGGYWEHAAPIRFSWKPQSVEERLSALPKRDWKKGKKAYLYLTDPTSETSYAKFLEEHARYLKKRDRDIANGDRDILDYEPFLPMNFMETEGLECAAWPHLYWRTDMCETYARLMDVRRQKRKGASSHPPMRGDSSDEEETDEEVRPAREAGRQSAKASFLAKVFSAVVGYGADWKLGQFVYDLWMWSSLGAAKHCGGPSLRMALAGRSFAPAYWENLHFGLVDVVKQIGFPSLFVTIAPWEPSAPYHAWLEDELHKTLRSRTNLPAAESFHLAHVLLQVAEGMICGTNRQNQAKKDRCWKEHVLAAADGQEETVVEIFGRLEFQDGKRKRHVGKSQSYHGAGRAHLHLLVWLKNPGAIDWSDVLRADLPAGDESELKDLVVGSQLDYHGQSGWAQREEATQFDVPNERILLHHPRIAKEKHVRAYMPDVLQAMECHMDVQASDGRSLLLQYVASYAPKFSDSFATAWLNEEASDYHLARKVLTEYHPMEPEMWLQLDAQHFPQVVATPVIRKVVVRPPWTAEPGKWEQLYMKSTWRPDDWSLLQYVRASNLRGAKRATTRGGRRRVAVAVRTNSRLKDSFYGQWLVLNVPFRSLDELWDDRALLVPDGYRMLALCLLKRPGFWRRPLAVLEDLKLEGHREPHIRNVLAMLESHTSLVDSYLTGRLNLQDDPEPEPTIFSAPELGFQGALAPEQAVIVDTIREMVTLALQRRYPEETGAEDFRQILEACPRAGRPVCILGPAGSGKSTCVEVAIHRATQAGAHVGIACPTGMLASGYREKFPDLDVDTVHGMFLLHKRDCSEAWCLMAPFDLVVIDEIGQLQRDAFEWLMHLWNLAGRRPALVLVGDFHQLRGIPPERGALPTRAPDSDEWRQVVVRHLRTMRRCQCEELRWKLELLRTAKPSKEQLKRMLRGHRAMPDIPGHPAPTLAEMEDMLSVTPQTTFLTITRRNAALLNELAVEALFGHQEPLCTVPGDPESNTQNYGPGGYFKSYCPAPVPVYLGARVTLTRNVDKEKHFVNGMTAEVIDVKRLERQGLGNRWNPGAVDMDIRWCVTVRTRLGTILTVYPYTDEDMVVDGRPVTYLPLRLGYAVTLVKVQGATLDHATIWLDVPNVEAAGYVALSRVRRDADWRFIGHATPHHFSPASGIRI